MMEVPTAQEKSEQIFFAQPKVHQNKFADLSKMVPTDLLKMIAFLAQCQETNKSSGILKKIAKDKKRPKEKKKAHLPALHSCQSSYRQHRSCKYHDYHQSNCCDCNIWQSNYCDQDNQHHICLQHNSKDSKSTKSYDKKDDCKRNHSKNKSNEAMHNDQSYLSSAGSLSGRRSRYCSRSPLCSCSQSFCCLSNRSYNNHHVAQDYCRPNAPVKCGYSYFSKSDDGRRIHHPNKSSTIFATFSTPIAKKGKCTQK